MEAEEQGLTTEATLMRHKAPRLMIYNPKGGVGKTAIALNFALTAGYGAVTNDPATIIEDVLPSAKCLTLSAKQKPPDIPSNIPLIYDFGGFPDKLALEVLDKSQYVMVPVLPLKENVPTNLNFLEELRKYKSEARIILIINQTVRDQFTQFAEIFKTFHPDAPIFEIKKSTVFWRMVSEKKSLRQLAAEAASAKKIYARSFEKIADQFNEIMKFIGGISLCH